MNEAEAALEGGNLQVALENANRAIERDSLNTSAYIFKADVLRRMADSTMEPGQYIDYFRRATSAEEEAMSIDPDLREDVVSERRRVYAREVQRAEDAYNRASKDEREDIFRRSIGFFGAAGATQPDSARPVLNEAYARLQVGQKKQVIPVLERYLERADPANKKAFQIIGELYLSTGQYEKAKDVLDRATAQYPGNRSLQGLRLNAYNRAGDVDEALAVYREQIEKDPEEAAYRYNYGALLLKAGRYDEAIDQLSRAVELRPDDADGQYNLGAAYLNAALAREDSISMLEEEPPQLQTEEVSLEEKIEGLRTRRQELFENAVPPLERARALTKEEFADIPNERTLRRDACRALLVAYVQTDRPGKAAQVEGCTEFASSTR